MEKLKMSIERRNFIFKLITASLTSIRVLEFSITKALNEYQLRDNHLKLRPRAIMSRISLSAVNMTLQALVSCPAFYHLFNGLYAKTRTARKLKHNFHYICALSRFVTEFFLMNEKVTQFIASPVEINYFYSDLENLDHEPQTYLSALFENIKKEMNALLQFPGSANMTPIDKIFSVKLSNFETPLLNITFDTQSLGVNTLEEALENFSGNLFESLPPVLVINLKIDIKNLHLNKQIDFKQNLVILEIEYRHNSDGYYVTDSYKHCIDKWARYKGQTVELLERPEREEELVPCMLFFAKDTTASALHW